MIIEYVQSSGAIRVSDIIGDQWFSHMYMGYTKKEAKSLFKEYVQEELAKYIKGKPA